MKLQVKNTYDKIIRLFKSKKRPSLKYMIERVKEVSDEYGETFFSVEIIYHPIGIGYNSSKYQDVNNGGVCIKSYINGFDIVYGLTIDSVCQRLREQKSKSENVSIIQDVVLTELSF